MILFSQKSGMLKKLTAMFLIFVLSAGLVQFPFFEGLRSNAAYASDLFFSEYIEGTSYNKAVEIFNGTDRTVDLSSYSVELYSNGNTASNSTVKLSGILESGKVFVIAHPSASAEILGKAGMTSSTVNFNGNDAFVLKANGQVVDVIGQAGFDPGVEWGTGSCSTADNTLVRKSSVITGNTNINSPFDPSIQWEGFAANDFTHLGGHNMEGFGMKENLPPVITFDNPVVSADENTNVTITFKVDDDSQSVSASVYFKHEGEQVYSGQPAIYDDPSCNYSCLINAGSQNIEYYIKASDSEGLSSETSVYSIAVIKNETAGKHIIIIHTNDTHGRIKAGDGMGFARINTKIKELEASNPGHVLVLDSGDTFHGQTILSVSRGEGMARIMNKMGYDALAPGNHDFNYGQERLLELEGLTDFPILSANILKADGTPFLTPYIIKDVDGLKVAIFGLTTPETLYKTNPKNVEGLTFEYPVETARKMVGELKDKADVVIALAHLGLDEGSEVKSSDVAAQVQGIDLIIDGHSHTALPQGKTVNGTTIVQAGEYDEYLGLVDITVGADGSKHCHPELLSKEQAASVSEDEEILDLIAQIDAENSAITSEVIGSTDILLDGTRNHVRSNETNLGNLIADAMKEAADADVALINGGGIRADIDAGEITKGEVINVLPFGNYVVLKEVSGADILAALENGFSKYPAYDGRFPHISGMRVVFDPTKPAGNRVINLTIGGLPLDPDKTYRLATNDFIAAGGDQYTVFSDDSIKGEFAALDEILAQYIKKNGTSGAKKDGRVKSVTSVKAAVFSDPHYFAPELGTQGPAFQAYLAQDRKLLAESSAITEAAVDAIKSSDASLVLIAGDLTKDGEKLSHQQFAALIGELEAAGKKVYVICGNHDINNPEANSYSGNEAVRVENITPDEFKAIYNDFGYEEAISKDPNSLSYVAEPVPGLWIIAMDSCRYLQNDTRSHPETAGGFSPESLEWIKQQLREAEAQGKQVIGLMHHGILEHFNGQKQLFGEYVIDNWEDVSQELADLGMKAVFTGHYHAQDIVSKTTAAGNTINDIETGSLVTYPCPYRLADITAEGITVESSKITGINYDTGNKPFQDYARDYLKTGMENLVPYMLASQLMALNPALTQQEAYAQALQIAGMQPAPAVTSMTIKDMLVDAMIMHYQGDEKALPQVEAVVRGMASSSDPKIRMLGSALLSLYTDLAPQDNNTAIDFAPTMRIGAYTANPGKDVTVKVTMSNLFNMAGLKAKLTYDPSKLSVKNVTLSSQLGEVYAINTAIPGEILFNSVNSDGITKAALDIATITFSVNKECTPGDTQVNILTADACDTNTEGIPVTFKNGIVTVENAILPEASNVTFAGEAVVGQVLTAHYDYSDVENRPEAGTKFRWLAAEHGTGNYVELAGAVSSTLIVTKDLTGKDIAVEATPANAEDEGLPAAGHNGRNMVIRLGDVNKDGAVSYIDALKLLQSITGKIALDSQSITAGNADGFNDININDVIQILKADAGLISLD